MVGFRGCPRCRGDIHDGRDQYGDYKQCLQCGHVIHVDAARPKFLLVKGRQRAVRRKKEGGRTAA
jgi:hypothetical protein